MKILDILTGHTIYYDGMFGELVPYIGEDNNYGSILLYQRVYPSIEDGSSNREYLILCIENVVIIEAERIHNEDGDWDLWQKGMITGCWFNNPWVPITYKLFRAWMNMHKQHNNNYIRHREHIRHSYDYIECSI